MSLTQFYLDNGLGLEDLQLVDDIFANFVEDDLDDLAAVSGHQRTASSLSKIVGLTDEYTSITMEYEEEKKEEESAFMASIDAPTTTMTGVKPVPLLMPNELDYTAETAGWSKLDTSRSHRLITAYKQGDLYLEFDLMTSVVRGYDDLGQERVQRFCRVVEMADAIDVFQRPQFQKNRKRCRYGRGCKKRFTTCLFEHPKPSRCRYGAKCRNVHCAFDHS
jgi:hypothetical protein